MRVELEVSSFTRFFVYLLICYFLPVDRSFPMRNQVFIGTTEMLVSKETIISRQRRRMNGSQYQMLVAVNKRSFLLRIRTPQDKHQMFFLLRQHTDSRIRKLFPASALM